jgi:hypothetical protein
MILDEAPNALVRVTFFGLYVCIKATNQCSRECDGSTEICDEFIIGVSTKIVWWHT